MIISIFLYQWTKMPKSSKKGRLTGEQRKQMNRNVVHAVMEEEVEDDILFGRVLRHLGAGHVRVLVPSLHPDGSMSLKKEGIAKIKTALSRRGSTPIGPDDVVILSGRDFETSSVVSPRFDLLGILTRAEAAKLEREGRIPSWMMQVGDKIDESNTADDIFDYTQDNHDNLLQSKNLNHKRIESVQSTDSHSHNDIDIDIDKI
jgi:hypothetical protein